MKGSFIDSEIEIKFLKNYLSDKLHSINMIRDELRSTNRSAINITELGTATENHFILNVIVSNLLENKIEKYYADINSINRRLKLLMSRQEKEQNPPTSFHPSNLFNMVENQNCQEAVILTATLSKEALRHTKLKYDSYGLEIVQTANNLLHPGDKVIHHQGEWLKLPHPLLVS